MEYFVTCGPNAQSFHDAATGVTVAKGEVVKLTEQQYKSSRVRQALLHSHLVISDNPEAEVEKGNSEEATTKLYNSLKKKLDKGTDISKIAEKVTMDQLLLLASAYDVEVEETDTKADILEAIFSEPEETNEDVEE